MQAWGLSDPGIVRSENQDAFAIEQLDDSTILAVVCDGMGGAKAGNVASDLALDVFTTTFLRSWRSKPTEESITRIMQEGMSLANRAVYEQAQSDESYLGMGTTLVAAVVRPGRAAILNIGDSRAYRCGEEGICCVTVDHSFVQMMVDRGALTRAQAMAHPDKNLITRAIGTADTVEGDIYFIDFSAGDNLLLCSDGLTNVVTEQELLFEIVHGCEKSDCCRRLLEIAQKRGAPDNVTAILISG